ncbi:MAG: hypothetical protein JSV21_02770, partial [Nitrospirota bacterium]
MMKNILYLIISVLLILPSGCAVSKKGSYIKEGKEYGVTEGSFRSRWWNFYERGVSFADGGFYDEAIDDLIMAIKMRSKDQWRARTYGMHFVSYFPHRELGIIFYNQGKYDDAVGELEASLATADSSKAKFFLNKARKALIEQTGSDKLAPIL